MEWFFDWQGVGEFDYNIFRDVVKVLWNIWKRVKVGINQFSEFKVVDFFVWDFDKVVDKVLQNQCDCL